MRLALAFLLVGCAASDPPAGYPVGLGTTEDPLPNEDGYPVASRVAMPLGSAAVDAAIARIGTFSTRLAAAVSGDLAGSLAGDPAGHLPAWIDDALDAQDARTVLADIAAMATTITGGFTLQSNLAIAPAGALHGLTALEFRPAGLDVIVPIGGLDADAITQRPTAEVGMHGMLTVGDETFRLALGDHATHALELAIQARHGAFAIDCTALAASVAARCASGSCVGHASELAAACAQTSAALVGDVQAALAPVALEAHFVAGTGRLVDTTGDGIADSVAGTWEAENDVGLGATSMEIAFATDR